MKALRLCVSVIVTVYNEGGSIRRLLDSLAAQTRPPEEVIICDGGSTDDTVSIVQEYAARLPNLRVLVEPGANISRGRNLAITAAAGPVIAVTDAGVRLDERWLEKLVEPFEKRRGDAETQGCGAGEMGENCHPSPHPMAVAGFFMPDGAGIFQTAMAATVLPRREDIDPRAFLPSSRSVAFTKEVWARAGGYPEWLDYCEDLVFDFAVNSLREDGKSGFVWAPEAIVYFRPRPSLASFWTQYYRYARGDGKADLWRTRHALRYATYLVVLPALIGHGLRGRFVPGLGWLGLGTGLIVHCWRPWQRLIRLGAGLGRGQWLQAALLVPLIRGVGDAAKMAGYPAGLLWRWRHRRCPEVHWRDRRGG